MSYWKSISIWRGWAEISGVMWKKVQNFYKSSFIVNLVCETQGKCYAVLDENFNVVNYFGRTCPKINELFFIKQFPRDKFKVKLKNKK